MFGLTKEDLFAVVWIGVCLIAFLYSLSTYGYMVWFKPEEFMKLDEEKKKKSPRWIKFFMMSTTVLQDLWTVRIIYLLLCLIVLFGLVFVILRVLGGL